MKAETKHRLDERAYEMLRETIKEYTSFNNLNKDNIELRKEAVKVFITWLEKVYNLDTAKIELDMEGQDLLNLFKTT